MDSSELVKGFGAIVSGKRLSGNLIGYAKGGFPNITKLNWSQDGMAKLLETGMTEDGDRVGGPMVEVVRSTSQLSPEDRAAMAAYLVSLPPIVSAAVASAPQPK